MRGLRILPGARGLAVARELAQHTGVLPTVLLAGALLLLVVAAGGPTGDPSAALVRGHGAVASATATSTPQPIVSSSSAVGSRALPGSYLTFAPPVSFAPVQQAKLGASDPSANGRFGAAVAISGETVVIGAPDKNANTGAAYVFVRTGSTWSQQAKLTASDAAASDRFGIAVAVSGETVVVGAPDRNASAGAVYVYVRSGATWSEQQRLVASDAASNDRFGAAVAVSGDTAVIGSPEKNGSTGMAYAFVRSGTTWSEQRQLTASDAAANDSFGIAVSFETDTAVVGASGDNSLTGAAYIFTRSGTIWSQQQKLTASDAAGGDEFGWSVALHDTSIAVGARNDSHSSANLAGAVYAFVQTGSTWSEQAKLTAADAAANDRLGYAVAAEGDTVVSGAVFAGVGAQTAAGAAYAFVRSGTTWSQESKATASDAAADDNLGWSVAFSQNTTVVGVPLDDDGGASAGAVYVFTQVGATPTPTNTPTSTATATASATPTTVAVPTSPPAPVSNESDGQALPSPTPLPTVTAGPPVVGRTGSTLAIAVKPDRLRLEAASNGEAVAELDVGFISLAGQVVAVDFIRDANLGQTYALVRRESDSLIVRRWVSPLSPLRYQVPWDTVKSQFTFSVDVVSAVPLDEHRPQPGHLVRRFDGSDDRIFYYDAIAEFWRWVPDIVTFQSLGLYWCDVTSADQTFFERIAMGPSLPQASTPVRDDYPACRSA
ncbi:MAG: hypothetical protein CL878_05825 [Dehalococcoidia bacterium]|nr:hypothetical protein [Dehalococcoidia bacterium]